MSTLTIILFVIAGLLLLVLAIAAMSGKEMNIQRSVLISKPVPQVFEYLKYVKNHDNFNVWMMMDPDMKREFRGTDGNEGFVYAWDSSKKKNVGAGEQEIKKIVPGERIDYELRFFRPMQDVAQATLTTTPAANGQTKVDWTFRSKMKFPMNIMKPMIQNMLGGQLEAGLNNLKAVMEK